MIAIAIACVLPLQASLAKNSADSLKQRERNSISLELEFSRKSPGALERFVSLLSAQPNAYATGFFVSSRLVLTSYHVVSGNLDPSKKVALGYDRRDELEVRVYTNGCQARLLKVDEEADLALLEVCGISKAATYPSFQPTLTKDEGIVVVAHPRTEKVVGHGTLFGSYTFHGIEYWSGRVNGRDGFSGSPVYNQRGELVGVFSGYDWSQDLAIISPGARAEKLVQEFMSPTKP